MNRRNRREIAGADDIDSAIGAVFKPEDFVSTDDPVLDDPVEVAARKLFCAPGPHPRRDPKLAAGRARGNPRGQRFHIAAGKCDFRQVEFRHAFELAI